MPPERPPHGQARSEFTTNHGFGGRLKGKPNKINGLIKEAALMVAEIAGNEFANKDKLPGLVNYLRIAAKTEPVAFLGLLAKILPTQLVDPER